MPLKIGAADGVPQVVDKGKRRDVVVYRHGIPVYINGIPIRGIEYSWSTNELAALHYIINKTIRVNRQYRP